MNEKYKNKVSKFLSLVLRHQPELINLELDKNGWAKVSELLTKAKTINITIAELENVVSTNDKQRFAFNDNKSLIRANQGHSVKTIDLDLKPINPPEFLYHGTVNKFIDAIRKTGLQKRSRQHVHLSENRETAIKVGSRRGLPIILSVRSGDMQREGFTFYCSANNVWLTDHVPSKFIDFKTN